MQAAVQLLAHLKKEQELNDHDWPVGDVLRED
jgi:hypothetical protein